MAFELAPKISPSTQCRPVKHLVNAASLESNMTEIIDTHSLAAQSLEQKPKDVDNEDEEDSLSRMSAVCPLWDSMLPLDASGLKLKQVS